MDKTEALYKDCETESFLQLKKIKLYCENISLNSWRLAGKFKFIQIISEPAAASHLPV